MEDYAQIVRETVGGLGTELIFEPGRLMAGNAGVLVAQVLYVKEGATRTFIVVDGAMNDLMRPALYGAHHEIQPVVEPKADAKTMDVDVVGPVCETGDTFAKARRLAEMQTGDLLVFRTAGAYGATLSSSYNTRPLVPEVMVDGPRYAVVRPRLSAEEIIRRETLPEWLA